MDKFTSRRWFGAMAGLGGLGLLAHNAQAQGGMFGGGHHGRGGARSAEDMAKHMDERISRLIEKVGGTPEQKDRLVKLAQTAAADMKPLREQHMAARKKGMELLSGQSIDRAALERLRQEQMTSADAMSKRMVQHMADAAEVLTPAQRTQVAQQMNERMERGGRHGGMRSWFGASQG
jgi:periplasmic protein CpxP/Spy